jgi:hypothetical protein
LAHHPLHVVQGQQRLDGRESDADHSVGGQLPDAVDDLDEQLHTAYRAGPESIVATVGLPAQELLQQVAMRRMQFDSGESAVEDKLSGGAKVGDQARHFVDTQPAGWGRDPGASDGGRRCGRVPGLRSERLATQMDELRDR